MDWIPEWVKGQRAQGAGLAALACLILFLILTPYDIREFNAFGFHVVIPDHTKGEVDALKESLGKAKGESANAIAELVKARVEAEHTAAELTKAMALLKQRDVEVARLQAEPNVAASDTKQIDQAQKELASTRSQRDGLEKKVADLTARLKSSDKAIEAANKRWEESKTQEAAKSQAESVNKCGVPNDGLLNVMAPGNTSWIILEGKITLHLRTVAKDGVATFASNLKEIDKQEFSRGSEVRIKLDGCTYVFVVTAVDGAYQIVALRFFSL
jgi:hypothetical protein